MTECAPPPHTHPPQGTACVSWSRAESRQLEDINNLRSADLTQVKAIPIPEWGKYFNGYFAQLIGKQHTPFPARRGAPWSTQTSSDKRGFASELLSSRVSVSRCTSYQPLLLPACSVTPRTYLHTKGFWTRWKASRRSKQCQCGITCVRWKNVDLTKHFKQRCFNNTEYWEFGIREVSPYFTLPFSSFLPHNHLRTEAYIYISIFIYKHMLIYVWIYTQNLNYHLLLHEKWVIYFFYMTKFQEYFWLQYTQFECSWEAEEAARNKSESV